MFSFSLILPSGLWTYHNKTSSNSAALFTMSARRQKEISNSLPRNFTLYFFFFFHILFETWQEQNIQRQSEHAQFPPTYTWLCILNYLPAAASLKEAVCVLYVHSYDGCWSNAKVFGSQSSSMLCCFCPLISPLVQTCLSTPLKTTWPATTL